MASFQPQLDSIGRQRDFTQSLLAQTLAPQQHQNAATGIARLLSAYLANKNMGALNKQEQDITGQQSQARRSELSRILSQTQDQPAHMLPPDQVGPSAPARPGIPMAQALMGSEIPEFQEIGLQHALKPDADNTPSNVAEWNFYNSLDDNAKNQYLNMKRSGFGAGGVRYDASGKQITPTNEVADNAAAIAAAEAAARAKAETNAAKDAKNPVLDSMKYVIGQYADIFPKINTGGPMGAVGKASKVFDSQDTMRFENLNQQLSTELRTVFRIPGEGTLSDREQAQYGLQLPSVNYDQATNEAIIKDLETRAGIRIGQPVGASGAGGSTPKVGDIQDGYRFKGGSPSDPNSWEPI